MLDHVPVRKKLTLGFLRMARAMAMRCFCPPESCTPLSPTGVLYPRGSMLMKSCAFAVAAALATSSMVAPRLP